MHSSKPFILFFSPVRHAASFYRSLQGIAHTEVVTSKSRDEFFKDAAGKYKDIFAIYRTSASNAVAGKFDAEFIEHLPPSCKYIFHNGAGYDPIDTSACGKRGIIVTNAPDPVTDATADLAIFLLLGALRQLNPSILSLRAGNFKEGLDFGHDPQGKTLGILGMGRIGRATKQRCDAFGLKTIYYNRRALPSEQAAGAEYVSFEKLLIESDIISINVPLNANTKHLMSAAEIAKMKRGVVIINTARGAIIDEAAMADALENNHIAAVGLDVYEREPEINEKLMKQERALVVPHVGTHTTETLAKMETWAMENARRAIVGEPLLSPVPEAWDDQSWSELGRPSPELHQISLTDITQTNASIIRDIFQEVAAACPDAFCCVVTNPVNSTVPVAAETLKQAGVFEPTRLFGVTTLEVVRASTFAAQALGSDADPKAFRVPVIGGHSPISSGTAPAVINRTFFLPLLLFPLPSCKFSNEPRSLMFKIQACNSEAMRIVKSKQGVGSATTCMAYAGFRFVKAILRAMNGEAGGKELAAELEVDFFAVRVILGKTGAVTVVPVGELASSEKKLLEVATRELRTDIATGLSFMS
ncbi:hypothetical protein UA08_00895 [Talaromyces atroroseus]|uniref:Malate dehydrogenase n=1 Tax=Talaromyces atroroseus TaxID=1441469 RepID=A0A225BAB9_TALAT|nr:hypothetical protein UA08_00895 [Talaromyces atroroseus]OKL64326.1 hypothetical protein UA08_00895 [Talaromyces atroroseus]